MTHDDPEYLRDPREHRSAQSSWLIWLPDQEMWRTPTHWSWLGECEANRARSHFCAGGHAEGASCRCACGDVHRAAAMDPRAFVPERGDHERSMAILAAVVDAERPTGVGEGAGTAEAATALTDLVGLDPNLTGGLDPTEYIQRQNCDHGAELDRLRRQVQSVRELHRQRVVVAFDGHPITFDDCTHCDAAWPCPTIQALDGEA